MMRTQMDCIFRKRTGQKYFFSLAFINDKKTCMKANTRLLIYMDKQRSGPVFLYEVFYKGGTFPGGDSHIKQTGMLVGNFEFNP